MIMIMASLDNVQEDRAQVAGGGYISKEESIKTCVAIALSPSTCS